MNRLPFSLGVKLFLLAPMLAIFSGCASIQPAKSESNLSLKESLTATNQQSEGYALLFALVSKEKNVSKLLIIKKDSPPLKAIIQKVARETKQIAGELATLARQNPPLNLKFTRLPLIEQKTRELIEKETAKTLLRAKEEPFEFRLLQSQIEGLNYGAHLAEALLETETHPARRDFLQRTQRTLTGLREAIYQMLLDRYVR